MIDFRDTGLPLVPWLPRISGQLEQARALALSAEPGAGKSTLVPPYLLDEPWLEGRAILMLEPRRLAAVAVASRIAELLQEPLGRRAGYRVRTSSRVSRETRIEVVTEALLTRRIQEDPLLDGVGLVIFDEFHERSIHADLALALALEVRRARPDLALLVMSATLDTEGVASLLGATAGAPAPSLHCPGSVHPVQVEHRPLRTAARWEEEMADGLGRLFDETTGDILAFLPGAGEIRRVASRLSPALAGRAEVLPLHGTMRLEDQRRVIGASRAAPRRVILATSIAETSLTVPGIAVVADSGWARLTRFHPATGLDRLVTERVSASSAEQRRGRAGRLGPGRCVRFWPGTERLLERPDPEILRSDLSGLVLECALWGAEEPGRLSWLDVPPAAGWSQAREVLSMLGLVDRAGPTPLGRSAARLGLSPRLSVLVLRGSETGAPALGAACAALMEERDGSEIARDPDFRLRLEMIRTGSGGAGSWRAAVRAEMERILRRLPGVGIEASWTAEQEARVGSLLAGAFPDRLARREPDGTYRLVTGRVAGFSFGRHPVPTRAAGAWVVALDADPGETTGIIRLAAPVETEEAQRALAFAAQETAEIRWEGLVPRGMRVRRAGRLVLTERPERPASAEIAAAFQEELTRSGLAILPWNRASTRLLARMRFHARAAGKPQGELSDQDLAARWREWLLPFLSLGGGQLIGAGGLHSALAALASTASGRFDQEVPESLRLPNGARREIEYEGGEPAVEARIQEVFGLAASPRVCGVPITFRLLSPANRPLQVTRDLENFWSTTYAEVRKEMRGRYPRHYWPEDPSTAGAITGTRPRKRGE
ncbi:MAG TPA: ATP-dependent helicase HrpB [Spirochaetia bacterium]|nr:ATP-dependent helicase HrpB [Spirochaetia bacterium]